MTKHIDAGSSGEWGWHATELALRCPQLFAYHHRIPAAERGGESGDRAPLLKGSLVHQGLAHHYARVQSAQEGRDPEEWATPDVAIEACAEKLGKGALPYVALAQSVVRAYAAHHAAESLEVMHVEEVFAAEIGGYRFTQRFDLVARDASGRVVILDHKTTGRIDAKVPQRYVLSGQFLGMLNFGRSIWGDEFGGVRLNLIELGGDDGWRTGSPKFSRVPVDPAPHALRLFPITVKHARDRIHALDAAGTDPWEWPKALSEQTCITAYGKCDGYELCRWGKAGSL